MPISDEMQQIENRRIELKQTIRDYQGKLKEASKDVAVKAELLNTAHSPKREAQLEAAEQHKAELQVEHDECVAELNDIETRINNQRQKEINNQIEKEAQEVSISIPAEDPSIRIAMCAGMAQQLQYMFVSGKNYYGRLSQQLYLRRFGEDAGSTAQDAPIPEINYSTEQEFERMQKQRHELAVLRTAIHYKYEEEVANAPAETKFIPKELFRTDSELEQHLDKQRAVRSAQRAQEDAAVSEKAKEVFAMTMDTVPDCVNNGARSRSNEGR